MSTQHFSAALERPEGVGTWTYVTAPINVEVVFGTRGQVPVKGTVNGVPFRNSLRPHGDGRHYLAVNREIREAAGVGRGDTVEVILERDTEARTVEAPADLLAALEGDPAAGAAFDRLAPSHRREYAEWVEGARRPVTRLRRIARSLEMLITGGTPKRDQASGASR